MSNSVSTFQILSEKLPTTHPALLLGPLAIAAWMLAPGLAPLDAGRQPPGPLQAAWNAARGALAGEKPAAGTPTANSGVPANPAPTNGGPVVVEQTPSPAPQIIVVPGADQPFGAAPATYAGAASGISKGTGTAAGISARPVAPQAPAHALQPIRTATPYAPSPAPRPMPARVGPQVVFVQPFVRPPLFFARPFAPMPRFGYGRPMMRRTFVGGFGGRRR
jgi:hypothetical protein